MDWTPIIIAIIGGGGFAQLIAALVKYYTSKKGLAITDDTGMRTSLHKQMQMYVDERINLITEITNLKNRCDCLEDEVKQAKEDEFQTRCRMQSEMNALNLIITDLRSEQAELAHLRLVVTELQRAKVECDNLAKIAAELARTKEEIDKALQSTNKILEGKLAEAYKEINRLNAIIAGKNITDINHRNDK